MRVNKKIKTHKKVRVIDENGKQIGILDVEEALRIAYDKNLDLVEISPRANPPVCKIIDYGKFIYQKSKKEKESKKAQHQIKVKEIKVRPNIDVHDLNTKIKRAKEFLKSGNKVKITCMFRGRQMLHLDLGQKLLDKIFSQLEDQANIETPPKQLGRFLTVVLSPK